MQAGKFNIVTDGLWGSCGKGLITTALADRYKPQIISTTNMANAGHTAVNVDGEAFVAKALPSATALKKWSNGEYSPTIMVGPAAAFTIDQMLKEINDCGVSEDVVIHPRAGVITQAHKEAEADLKTGTKSVASTMQGCGTFLADKIMRRPELKLARDYEELLPYIKDYYMPLHLNKLMNNGETILHEGAQGFSLDVNHGSHYPHCTSRGTTAAYNLADMGISPYKIGDIYLVIRPYPIRVGNVVENGETVGYSGDCYSDHKEISWAEVAANAGAPPEVMKGELTTVTKRLRRVFSFSKTQLQEAAIVNGATKIALNFANYIDYSCYGTNEYGKLPVKVKEFIDFVEDLVSLPVTVVGTGPQIDHVAYL